MTEEELKNIEQTTALLVENGLVIKNTDNFIREIGNTNLNDIINKLNALEKTANEGVNISAFVEDVTKSLHSIEELVIMTLILEVVSVLMISKIFLQI